MAQHRKILTANADLPDQHTVQGYENRGGYKAIREALQSPPASITERILKSGLRGRGGAGFLTGKKWQFIKPGSGKPVYVVHNADESEPGTFKDRYLLERDPHLCVEGTLIAAWAVQSNTSFIYIRGEYALPYTRMRAAIDECYAKGYLGENIFGSGFKHDIVLHRGAGAYICGEETALLDSLQGRKGQPRLKPPYFPAAIGLYGNPTIVNNTETLAACTRVLEMGAEEYARIGTPKSTGTKLMCASGHINQPGLYEVEMGYSLEEFLADECGGVWQDRKLKAVMPGGSSFPPLTAEEIKGVTLDFESLQAAGSALGSGGLMVMDDTCDMVEMAANVARFYAHESCGQCTPCREGCHWVEKIFRRILAGAGRPNDLDLVESICGQINGHTICAFGEAMAMPTMGFISRFRDEFTAKINARREQ